MLGTLSSDTRFAIINLLLLRGKLTFTDLKEELGIGKAALSFHLKPLVKAGAVKHFFEHEFLNERYSFYDLTQIGRNLADSFAEAFNPPVPLYRNKDVKSVSLSLRDTFTILWTATSGASLTASTTTSTSNTPQADVMTVPVLTRRAGH